MNYLADSIPLVMNARNLENGSGRITDGKSMLRLPKWPEPTRGVPNSFLRSALFAAIQGKTRQFMAGKVLPSLPGSTIVFTGRQLDQADFDVWQQAMHLAGSHVAGDSCCFVPNAFLKAVDRDNGKAQYRWLEESIQRLASCTVEIHEGSLVFRGSLLSDCIRDRSSGVYRFTLHPDMLKLYREGQWTPLPWGQRPLLRSKPLALWLYGFYACQADSAAITVKNLRALCGSANKDEYDFKRRLQAAFVDLKRTSGVAVAVDGDSVVVKYRARPAGIIHFLENMDAPAAKRLP